MALIQPGPTPRVQGKYLVVAVGSALPKLCVRTGRSDDLMQADEDVRTDGAGARAVGAFGAAWAYEDGPVRYWINRGELERLRRLHRIWQWAILGSIGVLVVGLLTRLLPIMGAGFVGVCVFVATYKLLPKPLSVAAVWGGQVFLMRVPPEVVRQVVGAASRNRSSSA
jgi:hypothetical protein